MTSSVILGIAGTAKNTGKTTALNALLAEAHERRVAVAVTSIGYDGESIDNVTGLPKPRILLHAGTIATTSRACLPSKGWEVVERTEWSTALGEILIIRCLETGPIVLAGPSTRRDLAAVVERMRGLGAALTLVDGALNRLAPMSVASSLILSTGAARSADLNVLAAETAAIESILSTPVTDPRDSLAVEVRAPFPKLDDIRSAMSGTASNGNLLRSRLPVTPSVLLSLSDLLSAETSIRAIELPDPVTILLSGDPIEMVRAIEACRANGIVVSTERSLNLRAVTVNPFLARPEGHGYVADAVSAVELRRVVSAAVRSPVIDVVHDGRKGLWDAVFASVRL